MAQRRFAQFGGLRDRESAEQASPVFTTGLGDPKEIRRSKRQVVEAAVWRSRVSRSATLFGSRIA